jgi:hypothetical protein
MKRILSLTAAVALAGAIGACTQTVKGQHEQVPTARAVVAAATSTCPAPTPTTAAGYAAMFAALPTAQWGAADVSISVRVGPTNVWLFGDTISRVTSWSPFQGGFVHSTAVTQRYGCLHVSVNGAELLPSEVDLAADMTPIPTWYWIKSARSEGVDAAGIGHLRITADRVQATGTGAWDFAVVGQRTAEALLFVDTGDVVFDHWTDAAAVPVQNIVRKDGGIYAPWTSTVSEVATGKMLVSGLPHTDGHFSYAPSVHPETRMASGRTLMTVCQNRTPLTAYTDYRPLFFEVTLS